MTDLRVACTVASVIVGLDSLGQKSYREWALVITAEGTDETEAESGVLDEVASACEAMVTLVVRSVLRDLSSVATLSVNEWANEIKNLLSRTSTALAPLFTSQDDLSAWKVSLEEMPSIATSASLDELIRTASSQDIYEALSHIADSAKQIFGDDPDEYFPQPALVVGLSAHPLWANGAQLRVNASGEFVIRATTRPRGIPTGIAMLENLLRLTKLGSAGGLLEGQRISGAGLLASGVPNSIEEQFAMSSELIQHPSIHINGLFSLPCFALDEGSQLGLRLNSSATRLFETGDYGMPGYLHQMRETAKRLADEVLVCAGHIVALKAADGISLWTMDAAQAHSNLHLSALQKWESDAVFLSTDLFLGQPVAQQSAEILGNVLGFCKFGLSVAEDFVGDETQFFETAAHIGQFRKWVHAL